MFKMSKFVLYFWSTVELHINNIIKRYLGNRWELHPCGEIEKKSTQLDIANGPYFYKNNNKCNRNYTQGNIKLKVSIEISILDNTNF